LYATAKESIERLTATIRSLPREWTGASVIIPPHDHLALNLNLPFGDSKNLDRIVDLEVQDVVPFELDDFVVQYSPLGPSSLGGAALAVNDQPTPSYDVHVGLMPRLFVRNLLFFCKAVGIEPNIITVPSSALASVYHLGKDFFKTNSAVVFNRGDEFSMAVFINGEVRVERVLFGGERASCCKRVQSTLDRQGGLRATIAAAVVARQLRADDANTPACQKWLVYSWAAWRADMAPRSCELSSFVHRPAAVA
jgi:hypothetical protein